MTQAATDVSNTFKAPIPNISKATIIAGVRAIKTSRIRLCVVTGEKM